MSVSPALRHALDGFMRAVAPGEARDAREARAAPRNVLGFAPDRDSRVLEALHVYRPWTGLVLEMLPIKDERQDDDALYVSTLSPSELRDKLWHGARTHTEARCFQAFVTDVRIEVKRLRERTNKCTVAYTPFYKIWLPADGSLFEVSGDSLPAPVDALDGAADATPKAEWTRRELYEMELHGVGEGPLAVGMLGEDYTFIPVLQKACTARQSFNKDAADAYPPATLPSSRSLPLAWRQVVALPHASRVPTSKAYADAAALFPHVGTLDSARRLAFTPVLLADVVAEPPEDGRCAETHKHAYRSACAAFLASARPLYDVIATGSDPAAHGWRRTDTERGNAVTHVWECTHGAGGKRKAEEVPGR